MEQLEHRCLLAITVDTELDIVDIADGVTSLREAITAANTTPGADEIVFDFGHDGPATILLEQGELEITEALMITGDGPELLTIDAQEQSRIFNITATTGDFTLAGMKLTRGKTTGDNTPTGNNTFSGGAIRSLSTGVLTIQNSVVSGNSVTGIGMQGGGVFAVGTVTVTSSTISENSTRGGGSGSGISGGTVTVTSSTISGNSAGDNAGGIYSTGTVTVTSSTISGNSAERYGGGILGSGTVTVTGSTISGNSAGFRGGGIYGIGTVTVTESTISGNSAQYGGGGIRGGVYGNSTVTVTSSTISGNSAGNSGGIWASDDPVTITGSIVALNTGDGTAPDLLPGTGLLSVGFSLIGDNTGTGLAEAPVGMPDANGNLIGGPLNGIIDPILSPLADNGGPTMTHALLPVSPALNAGDPAFMPPPDFDQRGSPFTRVAGGRIDMGAFELQTLGDMDFDGDLDYDDIDPLVVAFGDASAYETVYGVPPATNGDTDGDGDFDFDDIAGFVDLLGGDLQTLGDMDLDGDTDFDDIDGFVLGLRDAALYEATYGVPPATNGDTDADGDLDYDDIPGFVELLSPASVTGGTGTGATSHHVPPAPISARSKRAGKTESLHGEDTRQTDRPLSAGPSDAVWSGDLSWLGRRHARPGRGGHT